MASDRGVTCPGASAPLPDDHIDAGATARHRLELVLVAVGVNVLARFS
jgi:hypothetical protein